MLFHLLEQFPKSRFLVIADYKADVLQRYLHTFASDYDVEVIDLSSTEETGTCSGIQDALAQVEAQKPLALVWCDLVLNKQFEWPESIDENHCGISNDFECRWSLKNGHFTHEASMKDGVAGLFVFKEKSELQNVPRSGEFVQWLSTQPIAFKRLELSGVREFGTLITLNTKQPKVRCRPFNRIQMLESVIEKHAITPQGEAIAQKEEAWYKYAQRHSIGSTPKIYDYSPLIMRRIQGKNIYDYTQWSLSQKKILLEKIVSALGQVHSAVKPIAANREDCENTYITKTFQRLEKVKNLVPFARDETIRINGVDYENVFHYEQALSTYIKQFFPDTFHFIHGDPTFSNMMLEEASEAIKLIDPRGYFASTDLYGDVDYDWAKLYYSLVGNYDPFNRGQFTLEINGQGVDLNIRSNEWEALEPVFFELTGCNPEKIKVLHAIIWLSLTTYAWEDYDSICAAFYNGLIHFAPVASKLQALEKKNFYANA